MILRFAILILSGGLVGLVSSLASFSFSQVVSVVIFSLSMVATLLFWSSRVGIAFWGIAALLLTKTVDIEHLVLFSSLEVILFLVGMMVIIGLLREVNFFDWVLARLITIKGITARKLIIALCLTSAIMACLVDEVTSIIFMIAMVFALADYFETSPTPFLIVTVMSTNVGSTGSVLGNPIGILIATKAGLTFEDFLLQAFPLMVLVLLVTIGLVLFWYRDHIKELDKKIRAYDTSKETFTRLVRIPMTKEIKKEFFIFLVTLLFIGLHHRLEQLLGLPTNILLFSMPLISAGFIMLWRSEKAKQYIERDVDWWTLIFFMLLFAQVGTLKYTGVTEIFSHGIAKLSGGNRVFMITFILWLSSIGSSIIDNVVLVTTFIPVISELKEMGIPVAALWWALLFGGCLGGNITMVGSTANIVALGLLEKHGTVRMSFLQWFKIGLTVGLITTGIVWVVLTVFDFLFGNWMLSATAT